jgi:hypothetical protein
MSITADEAAELRRLIGCAEHECAVNEHATNVIWTAVSELEDFVDSITEPRRVSATEETR